MRKLTSLILVLIVTFSVFSPREAKAEMPVKARAFLTIIGYGAAGGALLGAASTAFGTSSRAIAQGASLGLYAGILFGTYVLVSHHNKGYGSYDDNSPYQKSNDIYGDEYNSNDGGSAVEPAEEGQAGGFFNRMQVLNTKFQTQKSGGLPPLQINILNMSF